MICLCVSEWGCSRVYLHLPKPGGSGIHRNDMEPLSLTRSWLHTWAGGAETPAHPQSARITVYRLAETLVIFWVCPICHGEDLSKGETRITQISSSVSPLWFASKTELWTITTWNSFNCRFDLAWHKHANTTHTESPADISTSSNHQGWMEGRELVRKQLFANTSMFIFYSGPGTRFGCLCQEIKYEITLEPLKPEEVFL